MKSRTLFIFATLVAFFISGCLTAEYKEYKFELTGKNSGKLTVKFVNIMSKKDDEDLTKKEEIDKDFTELMDNYVNGSEMEKKYPNARLVSKRLFEENGKLCGEAVYEFSDIAQVELFKYDKKSPYMMQIKSLSSEEFYSSNGKQGPEFFSVVCWDKGATKLELINKITEPDEACTSLLDEWKKSNR